MTIGEWVNTTLITAANDELSSGGGARTAQADEPAAGGALQTAPPEGDLACALGILTRIIERNQAQGAAQEKAVAALVERLDGVARADDTLGKIANRFADLDRRDRTLLALAERLVGNERKNEQRLAVLASAMNVLANKIAGASAEESGKITADDLTRSLDSLKSAIDDLAARVDESPPVTVIEAPYPRATGNRRGNGGGPGAEPPPHPSFSYDELNQRAIDNTLRYVDDEEQSASRGGLMSRLFGGR
ncbi:MAG: hypothetical protein ACE5H8_11450 [Alphaproteobacteria bacterium]